MTHDMYTERIKKVITIAYKIYCQTYTLIVAFVILHHRRICSANYHTVTELAFQPYRENSGKEPLPNSVHQVGTGFIRQKPITNPTDAEVSETRHISHAQRHR